MIETSCECGAAITTAEASVGKAIACQRCGKAILPVCAELIADGAGAGDFDAHLLITGGPTRVGEQLLLGGVQEITLGKLGDRHIVLPGTRVSREHCKLVRLDFGPSRWEIHDNHSTNGVLVNGERVQQQELKHGDLVGVGEYELRFAVAQEAPPQLAPMRALPVAEAVALPSTAPMLSYGTSDVFGRPFLNVSDPKWVAGLGHAASFMLWGMLVSFLSSCIDRKHGLRIGIDISMSALGWFAAWLLTMPEPGAPENNSWLSVRVALRAIASVKVFGGLLSGVARMINSEALEVVAGVVSLAYIPQLFIFLLYFRQLAYRIPNPALAINAVIVMIGLPASVALILGAGLIASAAYASGAPAPAHLGFTGLALVAGGGGFLIFGIWYIGLLIWFRFSLP